MLLKSNEINQLVKDTVIFQEGDTVTHIFIILKGHILAKNRGSKITLFQGNIIGIPDLYIGKYISEYVVQEDAVIYPFLAHNPADLEDIFSMNKEYQGVVMYSLCNYIKKMNVLMEELKDCSDFLYNFVQDIYKKYSIFCLNNKQRFLSNPLIERIEPYANDFPTDSDLIEYYLECTKVPVATMKDYYGNSVFITKRHMEESAGIIAAMIMESMELIAYISDTFKFIINGNEPSLFRNMSELFMTLKNNGTYSNEIMEVIDSMVDEINRTDLLFERNANDKLPINRASFEEMYCGLISGDMKSISQDEKARFTQEEILKNSQDTLRQILNYSTLEKDKEIKIVTAINEFINLQDKLSTSDEARICRRELTNLFYELYEDVFYVAYESDAIPKTIELFLNFGLLDERLLSEEQIISIYRLALDQDDYNLKIYTVFEWLKLVYEGKKEPSKNEFDQEYSDYLRHLRKTESMTEEEEKARLHNPKERLHYEITNMFKVNNKIVHGQISSFVPCLYQDIFLNYPEKEFLTRERIYQVFERIRAIDYSAFYRESMYANQEAKIDKEFIMTEVFPDIILMPMAGSSSSMWQEISGKRRTNPGRFVLPIFMDSNLDDVMIRLFGRFRWELCRCIQGAAWNNLKHKSLTSEYMDYLQFYRKNHELTEERKEKLKLQIQKARNNSREVFVIDYEAWIKGEANGAIRLNRVVREIMATYCPFSKEIRLKSMTQPMFADAYARFQRECAKKIHEYELRIHAMQKNNAIITKEIADTLNYYRL